MSEQSLTESGPEIERPPHALTVPAFRYLWLNNVAFFMASNAQRFVFGWFVLDGLNGSETQQGLIVFALGAPAIFLVLPAGVWADRWDRRRLLFGSQLASVVAMAAAMLLVASGDASMGVLVILSVVAGAAGAVGQPVRASLVPALVSREQLYSAIAINAIAMTLSLITGAAFARLFGSIWGFTGAFGFMLGLFALGILALIPLAVPAHAVIPEKRPIWVETVEATKFAVANTALRKLFGLLALSGLTFNPLVMVTMQAHVKEGLGRNSGDAALPFAMMGVGILISSVVVMRKGNMANKGTAFMRAMIFGTILVALMGRSTELWHLAVLSLFMGLAGGFYINMSQGLIQSNTPQTLMGRIMALFTLIQVGLTPLGALGYGLLARHIGTGDTMTFVSGAAALTVIFIVVTDTELRHLT